MAQSEEGNIFPSFTSSRSMYLTAVKGATASEPSQSLSRSVRISLLKLEIS